jgi:anti-anti-sigma factor
VSTAFTPEAFAGAAEDEIVLRLSDAMVADGLAELRWALHDALLAGVRRLVLDVSGVQSLSSSAVASFLAAHRTCRARGGGVVLTGTNRRTDDLLHRTGLWRVLLPPEPARSVERLPGEQALRRFSLRPPRVDGGA